MQIQIEIHEKHRTKKNSRPFVDALAASIAQFTRIYLPEGSN